MYFIFYQCIFFFFLLFAVKLVPGTEIAVAPKRRKRDTDSGHDSSGSGSSSQQHVTRAPMRLQDLDKKYIQKYDTGAMEIGITLTSVIFIHPESASKYSFKSLELVEIVPRALHKETKKMNEIDNQRINSRTRNEVDPDYLKHPQEVSPAVVRLLISESVAKGHVMLSQSLRLYLRAGLHSCRLLSSQISIFIEFHFMNLFIYFYQYFYVVYVNVGVA